MALGSGPAEGEPPCSEPTNPTAGGRRRCVWERGDGNRGGEREINSELHSARRWEFRHRGKEVAQGRKGVKRGDIKEGK